MDRKEYFIRYRLEHKKQRLAYLKKNKDRIAKQLKEYRLSHREEIKKMWKDYYSSNSDKVKATVKKWRRENKARKKFNDNKFTEKKYARDVLRRAVFNGKIIKKPCKECGDEFTHGHHNDYSKPLDVIWLCPRHHADLHNSLRSSLIPSTKMSL